MSIAILSLCFQTDIIYVACRPGCSQGYYPGKEIFEEPAWVVRKCPGVRRVIKLLKIMVKVCQCPKFNVPAKKSKTKS